MAVALVQWLWDATHILKVVVSNSSTVCLMDIFHNNFLKNCTYDCLKKTENKQKRGRRRPILKKT